ncbi:MFS transporter [Paraburkholderia antibiotica]|uniref:MFS transporter n=1 Tax=Paraburkholderia antibiotica TaxID=2728839 RepID=A0A7X9X6A3_9BURK|nr:MFS transporter [Paraburkholderia antibiotica]NML32294.1 MFS transporter [Paraburkholderia antibiotica]
MPFLFVVFMLSYLDRVNIGYAKLQFSSELHLSDTVFGLGAGIFFVGYFLFEVPSNLLLKRFGARLTISRIMILWGIASTAMMFVRTETQFYVLRFLLGVAEAGMVPGVILYLTFWFPANRRARMVAIFLAAIPASGMLGAPLSGFLMHTMHEVHGLRGWQWMFLIEGLPSIALGIVAYFYLDDSPADARWLSAGEKRAIEQRLAHEAAVDSHAGGFANLWHALLSARFWALTFIYFCSVVGVTSLAFWLPQIIRDLGVLNFVSIGQLTAIPYVAAAVGMLLVGWSSDRSGERRWHFALSCVAGAVGLVASGMTTLTPALAIAGLALAAAGIYSTLAIFWSMSASFLQGMAAVAGIAAINSISNLGGYVGPAMLGMVRDATGKTEAGLYLIAAGLAVSGLITLTLPRPHVSPTDANVDADTEAGAPFADGMQPIPERVTTKRH